MAKRKPPVAPAETEQMTAPAAAPVDRPVADEKTSPGTVTVHAGSYIELRPGERYFRCTDVNQKLSRFGVSAIAIVVEDFTYFAEEGAKPQDVKCFCVRQFYKDGRPSLDYTAESRRLWLEGLKKFLHPDAKRALENVLIPACRAFEREYKGFEADLERLEAAAR